MLPLHSRGALIHIRAEVHPDGTFAPEPRFAGPGRLDGAWRIRPGDHGKHPAGRIPRTPSSGESQAIIRAGKQGLRIGPGHSRGRDAAVAAVSALESPDLPQSPDVEAARTGIGGKAYPSARLKRERRLRWIIDSKVRWH